MLSLFKLTAESMNKPVEANGGNKRDSHAVTSSIITEGKVQFREYFSVLLQTSLWFWISVCRSISCQNDAEIWSNDQSTLSQNWVVHMNIKKLTTSTWEPGLLRHIRHSANVLLNACMLYFSHILLAFKIYDEIKLFFIISPKSTNMSEQ